MREAAIAAIAVTPVEVEPAVAAIAAIADGSIAAISDGWLVGWLICKITSNLLN